MPSPTSRYASFHSGIKHCSTSPDYLPPRLEQLESVDMLRLLEHGYRVKMMRTKFNTQAVDTQADLERVAELMEADPLLASY